MHDEQTNGQQARRQRQGSQPDGDVRMCRTDVDTPIGRLGLVANGRALVAILFDDDGPMSDESTHNPFARHTDVAAVDVVDAKSHPVLDAAVRQLGEYFAGERASFDVPLAAAGSDFQKAAWETLTSIPYGQTLTYGEQAERMGDRNKARAVGAANGKNPLPIVIPCHRVVGASGALTGFAGGVDVKAWLLAHESGQAQLTLGDC